VTWLKIDDGFAEHPKMELLGDRSFRLHVAALCYCSRNLTDGQLSAKAIKVLAAVIEAPRVTANLKQLVDAQVWVDNGDGSYAIYGYLEHNPAAEEVKARREERKASGAKGARKRWGKDEPKDNTIVPAIGVANAVELIPPDPDPDPDPTHEVQKPVRNQDSVEADFHALRLYSEVRERFQEPSLKREILSYAHKLPAAEFQSVIDSLKKNRREIKHEAKWVSAALEKRLEERRAA
jgi:hypothetical protein